jgi:CDP-glucose 4,6-dehydratase
VASVGPGTAKPDTAKPDTVDAAAPAAGGLGDALAHVRGRRVLVTGHTGFKGSWLALLLHDAGAQVHGYALAPEHADDHFTLLGLDRMVHHEVGDVRDADRLARAVAAARPEIVFHLAAQALVRRGYADPRGTFETNVLGTANLLEAVRATDAVRSVVVVTSDKCYENVETTRGYREDDRLGGKDPYSASKAAAEMVAAAWSRSWFAPGSRVALATVRAGNVVGGGDWCEDRLVPDAIRSLRRGEPLVVRHPHATRPWQHVLEPIAGYLLVVAALETRRHEVAEPWNFGPPERAAHTVMDVAREAVRIWGAGEVRVGDAASDMPEATLLHLNCDKARARLGWAPRWDFARTMHETVSWYRRVHDGERAADVTRAQASAYLADAMHPGLVRA